MSRRHALLRFDRNRLVVMDLGSENGTAADGELIPPQAPREVERVLLMGSSLFLKVEDVRPFLAMPVKVREGRVMGSALQQLHQDVQRAAELTSSLLIYGESGTGKESIAQLFHQSSGGRSGPFVAVNCAAIPHGLAERLLFGVKRGTYSGADADAEGYIQAAASGTLFLDEVAELDLTVQAKLLRVLESKEVMPLGATRARQIDFQICAATHRDLRVQIADKLFREDLYYRLCRPVVNLPPLRERLDEIPWYISSETGLAGISLHASFVEACLLRSWPGNVRELLHEARAAAQAAICDGSRHVQAHHLNAMAGTIFQSTAAGAAQKHPVPVGEAAPPSPRPRTSLDEAERTRLVEALLKDGGNVRATARALAMHRTQLRRLLLRYGIDAKDYATAKPTVDSALSARKPS
jgi:DNA-binding NtrC family response regulator